MRRNPWRNPNASRQPREITSIRENVARYWMRSLPGTMKNHAMRKTGAPRIKIISNRRNRCGLSIALRANIAETLLVSLITEQGGKGIQHEEQEDILSRPVRRAQGGRAKRGRTKRDG